MMCSRWNNNSRQQGKELALDKAHNPAMLPSAASAVRCPPQQIAKALGYALGAEMWKPQLIVIAFALTACADSGKERLADLGQEQGLPQCGTHQTFFKNPCEQSCAAPCRCLKYGVVAYPYPKVCARPCAYPWDCPDGERCGYVFNQGGSPVCMPASIKTPPGWPGGGSIDCDFDRNIGKYGCEAGALYQLQVVGLEGPLAGCTLFKALQRICPGACTAKDAGIDDAGWSGGACTGSPDAGPGEVGPDAGSSTTCCPVGPTKPWGGICAFMGGPKKAPNGCVAICGAAYTGKGKIVQGDMGCKRWQPL
jgi:hypothetical protein